jgi:hypothetical protein
MNANMTIGHIIQSAMTGVLGVPSARHRRAEVRIDRCRSAYSGLVEQTR